MENNPATTPTFTCGIFRALRTIRPDRLKLVTRENLSARLTPHRGHRTLPLYLGVAPELV